MTESEANLDQDAKALWQAFAQDKEVKNDLVMHYLPLVNRIVLRMMPTYNHYVDYDDLFSCGILGLMDAIDKFDVRKNDHFTYFADKRIRGEIIDSLRKIDWASVSLRSRLKKIRTCEEQLQNRLGRTVTDEEVAREMGMPAEKLMEVKNQEHIFNIIHFESILSRGNMADKAFSDLIEDKNAESGESVLAQKEQSQMLSAMIDRLNQKEQTVIKLYYYEEMRLKEIAQVLGVTESRVSQIHSSALGKLRKGLGKRHDEGA